MADNDEQERIGGGEGEALDGPPGSGPGSFGEIPVVRAGSSDPGDGRSVVEAQAAADAEAAGLQHWTAPPTGQVPAILSDRAPSPTSAGAMEGPSWHDNDSNWTGPGLAEVLGDGLGPLEVDDEDDEEEVAAYRDPEPPARRSNILGDHPTGVDNPEPTSFDPGPGPELPPRSPSPQARRSDPEAAARRSSPDGRPPSIDDIRFAERPQRTGTPAGSSGRPDGATRARPNPGPGAGAGRPGADGRPGPSELPSRRSTSPGPGRASADSSARRPEPQPSEEHSSGLDGSSDLGRRAVVGLALVVILAGALFLGPGMTLLLVVVLAGAAVLELYNSMRLAGLRPAILLGLVGAVATPTVAFYRGDAAFPLIVALTVVFGSLWYLVGADTERPVLNLSLTMMGVFWIGGLAGFAALIVRLEGGTELLLATIIITAASDIMAYVGGRAYGAKPFHRASPNKTWEGTITGFLGALFAGFAIGVTEMGTIWDGQSLVTALALGAVVGILAPAGDLAESVVKRDLGVKDMGRLLPGHGGVLDRVDALLFALPGAYYLALMSGLLDASALVP